MTLKVALGLGEGDRWWRPQRMAGTMRKIQQQVRRDSDCPVQLGRDSPASPALTPAAFDHRLSEPTNTSLSLQARGAAGDTYLAASFPLTPLPWSCGGKPAKRVCLCPLPAGEMVLQAHIKVMNLHGCYSETRIDFCFNYYFGK